MEEKSFRVLLDLSEINKEENEVKYVWMIVSPLELKTIFDLKRAINKKIPLLHENYNLFLREGLLLENEKISVLREEDTVKLKSKNVQHSFQECSFRSLNQIVTSIHPDKLISSDSGTSKRSKKRKSDLLVSPDKESVSERKQKKKKRDKSKKYNSDYDIDVTLNSKPNLSCVVSEAIEENNEEIFLYCQKENDTSANDREQLIKSILSNQNAHDDLSNALTHSQETEKNTVFEQDLKFNNSQEINLVNKSSPKLKKNSQIINPENESPPVNLGDYTLKEKHRRKRKRRRKRKQREPVAASESCAQTTPLKSNTVFNTTHITSEKSKHIIYESPISSPKEIETVTLDPDSITYSEIQDASQPLLAEEDMECAGLSELDMCIARFVKENKCEESVPETHQNTLSNIADMSLKVSTPYPKKKLKGQPWDVTPLTGNSKAASNTFIVKDCNASRKETTIKSYAEYPSLNCLPQVGTRLAFKVLELNKNYCPEVTDYKEGIVKNIDPNTDELTIELVQEEVRLGRTGKFENLKEDEIPQNEIIKTVILNWSALISPKQIS